MTKYRKGLQKDPQRTAKEHYTGPQRIGNTTKEPQRTAKEHYGLSCRKLAPIELNGALYSSARQDFSHAAGLSWEPALSDSQSVRRGRQRQLWTWKFHSSSRSSEASALCCWLKGAVRATAAARPARCVLVGTRRRCWHAAINIYCWQPNRPAPSRIQMLRRNWEVVVDQGPTARRHKTRRKNFD